jgi:hypothetical protein
MPKFLTPLSITPIGPGHWQVNADLKFEITEGSVICVPPGFVTDGASVPRPLWWLYPPFEGDYDAAAVLHDFLYRHPGAFTRAQVDAIFLLAMSLTHTPARKRFTIFYAVRAGGWKPWNRYRAEEQESV